jgi:hypothetical protein
MADEKESRQKKILIAKSRAGDVQTVEGGLLSWQERLEKSKGEQQEALEAEIKAESVSACPQHFCRLTYCWDVYDDVVYFVFVGECRLDQRRDLRPTEDVGCDCGGARRKHPEAMC